MKAFLKDQRGDAALWSAFIILLLTIFAMVIYTAFLLYSKYEAAQTELERAANVTVDYTAVNSNVRDIVLDIPADNAIAGFEKKMNEAGFEKVSDDDWIKTEDGLIVYQLEGLNIDIKNEIFTVTASMQIHIPWAIANKIYVTLPIRVVSKVLYISN